MITGIIPCAGEAKRFGGTIKALLPCDEFDTFLSRAVDQMLDAQCDRVFVICNMNNIGDIIKHVERQGFPNVFCKLQVGDNDIWSAIKTALEICETTATEFDSYLFAMPDTFFPLSTLRRISNQLDHASFAVGLFDTDKPERFGVVDTENRLVTNKSKALQGQTLKAWGLLGWRQDVVRFWRDVDEFEAINGYTHAINLAIQNLHTHYVDMLWYFDMATFGDYRRFLTKGVEYE